MFTRRACVLCTIGVGRQFSSNAASAFKLVVVGGGSAGIPVAARFAKVLPKGSVAIIEPKDVSWCRQLCRCFAQLRL